MDYFQIFFSILLICEVFLSQGIMKESVPPCFCVWCVQRGHLFVKVIVSFGIVDSFLESSNLF